MKLGLCVQKQVTKQFQGKTLTTIGPTRVNEVIAIRAAKEKNKMLQLKKHNQWQIVQL